MAALEPFDVVVAMRERTAFGAGVLERLPNLGLLVTTGPANVAIDVVAARRLGITVCGTGGVSPSTPTVELTWALIHALTRHVVDEDRRVRAGGGSGRWGPTCTAAGSGSSVSARSARRWRRSGSRSAWTSSRGARTSIPTSPRPPESRR